MGLSGKIDDDDRTTAVGLFNTARSYWQSAEHLNAAALKVSHPSAPVTFLFCHAIELYLKAYLRGHGRTVADLRKVGHRVANLAGIASAAGLSLGPEHTEILSHIEDADVANESRYIVTGFTTRLPNEALASVAEHLDIIVCNALSKSGLPVQSQTFAPPAPRRDDELDDDARRILVQLFQADDLCDRGVRQISSVLQIDLGMTKYHLDQLKELKFAQLTSASQTDT